MPAAKKLTLTAALALLGALIVVATAGAGGSGGDGDDPPGFARALAAQEQGTPGLLGKRAVVGTAVGLGDGGRAEVQVLTRRAGVGGIPKRIGGVPVDVVVTGPLSALHHRAGHSGGPGGGGGGDEGGEPSPSPTGVFTRPVPIGVSTGNAEECSAGTIGARVTDGTDVYALSNNHVYALENDVDGGEEVLQPGLYDTGCSYDPANHLGNLADFVPLDFDGGINEVDAAIASTTTALLGNSTPAAGYGTPSSTTADPELGLDVQKFGRTTSLTHGDVTGVSATVRVGYGSGTALFTGQILVEPHRGAGFIKAGDSGSLLVTEAGAQPVGLLFAGDNSGKLAIANDIDDVLDAFGVTVDGAP